MSHPDKPNKFKNSMGGRYLQGLFYEQTSSDKSSVIYTLKDQDHLGFPSLYRLYMETADIFEHKFAIQHLDGWEHWEQLQSCAWFKPYIERWRRELETRIRSEALLQIRAEALSDKANAYHANKYLLDGSWKPADATKRGRPTKAAIEAEAHQIASKRDREASDLERLGLGTTGKAN